MKKKYQLTVWIFILLLCFSVFPKNVSAQTASKSFRGVWVSTVYNLDYPSRQTVSEQTLKEEADRILDGCVEMGMTAVFLQVRPSADAFYPSSVSMIILHFKLNVNTNFKFKKRLKKFKKK